jgi:hypothetical protein
VGTGAAVILITNGSLCGAIVKVEAGRERTTPDCSVKRELKEKSNSAKNTTLTRGRTWKSSTLN